METEKPILTEVLCAGMNSQEGTEGDKSRLDAFLWEKLNLERRIGESTTDYHARLLAIQATQAGLIFAYEEEKDLERMKQIRHDFKDLLEIGNVQAEKKAIDAILTLYEVSIQYLREYSRFNCKNKVREKLKDWESLI